MAFLMDCPICEKSGVSSTAESCPGCGHNIAEEIRKIEASIAERLKPTKTWYGGVTKASQVKRAKYELMAKLADKKGLEGYERLKFLDRYY